MSSLRERLNRMKGTTSPSSSSSSSEETERDERSSGQEALAEVPPVSGEKAASYENAEAGIAGSDEWAALGAEWLDTEWGPFIRRTVRYPLQHRHGHYRLNELAASISGLDAFGSPVAVQPESLLFFDTETTGLGQGAGNVPFMIGLGFYGDHEFILEQLFIRNPAEELAMLAYLSGKLAEHSHLVSYNGRSFDWPLVLNRFVMNRLKPDRSPAVHLDFLHPSRSLWKHTLPSCKLGRVEEEKLGFQRVEDVPGSLAPTLYFRYLAEKDPEIMRGVFLHNEWDILSLAGLAIHFGFILDGCQESEAMADMDSEEVYRLGLWLAKMGKEELAEKAFRHLLARPAAECFEYWYPLGLYYKKLKQTELAVELWKRAVDPSQERTLLPVEPYVELAMYYEHARKDYAQALAYAEDSLTAVRRRLSLSRMSDKQRAELDALEKRAERLRRKASKPRAVESGRSVSRSKKSGSAPVSYAGSLFE
ncbi:ribonuclease H-like domain-containing protein [Gorillibacterium timonense]|uniref:ribonuclease H-like domain-containing protein n=1 Tax=Gorillibacterium timonense TaxID=1689269 RepID=UPI00071E5AE3|nr:ribonuclease H-like domain-containing protein [Gorillibacterium timonense]